MFCALVSSNPSRFLLDKQTLLILKRKIFKKGNSADWTEPCEPIDRLTLDVLSSQAYKITKASYTVGNEGVSEFHRKLVSKTVAKKLVKSYVADMEKKLKKHDSKELKLQPPRSVTT